MGKVMKTILISGVLLIGAGVVFLLWSAGNAQDSYEQSVAELNSMGVFVLETTAYDRDLLSSSATTVVSLNTGNPQLQAMVQSDPDFPWTGIVLGAPILAIWYWCTDQYIVQRILSAKDVNAARGGTVLAGFLKILPMFILVLPGLIAVALYPGIKGNYPETFSRFKNYIWRVYKRS